MSKNVSSLTFLYSYLGINYLLLEIMDIYYKILLKKEIEWKYE